MDLTQKKLSKSEWLNVEVPFPDKEKAILKLIIDGYSNTRAYINETRSMHSTMKLENNIVGLDEYIYKEYFEKKIKNMITKFPSVIQEYNTPIDAKKNKLKMKKGHLMRITNINKNLEQFKDNIFEYILLNISESVLKYLHTYSEKYAFHLYTLINVKKANVVNVNPYCSEFINNLIELVIPKIQMRDVINQSYTFIEKNPLLLKYEDITLYQHQRDIYRSFHYTPTEGNFRDPRSGKFKALSTNPGKLVLYTAPTGTGKTLTPLGLSEGYRIIFICAARHVGLALAKSAVCMGKKIGIAFGCETADDIRLHYYAASEYSVNKRTGGIGKVDNTVGDKVEIMICDIKSYLIAMHYMMAFTPEMKDNEDVDEMLEDIDERIEFLERHIQTSDNERQREDFQNKINILQKKIDIIEDKRIVYEKDTDIITYWDEPTISMDYDTHPLHELIKNVWSQNQISKMVLSCATLPQENEIGDSLVSYSSKFSNATIETISSYDCKKSISLLNVKCKSVLPHLLYSDYDELSECVRHCNIHKSLLRYFDLQEIIRFINKVHEVDSAIPENLHMNNYFENGISDITMNSLKMYYLRLIGNINKERWTDVYNDLYETQTSRLAKQNDFRRFSSVDQPKKTNEGGVLSRTQSVSAPTKLTAPTSTVGLQITTTDAHTLTDGPTIFLSNNVENLGKYYIQQTNLPERIYSSIYSRIQENTNIQKRLTEAENQLEFILDKMANTGNDKDSGSKKGSGKKTHKLNRDVDVSKQSPELRKLTQIVDGLRSKIQMVNIDDIYVPNSKAHQNAWTNDFKENAYQPNISEDDVCDIMALDVDNNKKMLLLLGIGVFINENEANPRYMEIMKKLAYEQHLYIILASSDYIYGTNYQFCHGYIGKDLLNMTQQKTIQALGRIGRNNMQQEYTIRFRDDLILKQLFKTPIENKEAIVMNRLFCE